METRPTKTRNVSVCCNDDVTSNYPVLSGLYVLRTQASFELNSSSDRLRQTGTNANMNIARRVPLVRNLDLVNETQVKQLPRLITLPLLQHDTPHSRLPHPQLRINVVGQRHFSAASLNSSSQLSSCTLRQPLQPSSLHTQHVTTSFLRKYYSTPSKMSFSNANTGSKDADPYENVQHLSSPSD